MPTLVRELIFQRGGRGGTRRIHLLKEAEDISLRSPRPPHFNEAVGGGSETGQFDFTEAESREYRVICRGRKPLL